MHTGLADLGKFCRDEGVRLEFIVRIFPHPGEINAHGTRAILEKIDQGLGEAIRREMSFQNSTIVSGSLKPG